jgi:hypothetical protein
MLGCHDGHTRVVPKDLSEDGAPFRTEVKVDVVQQEHRGFSEYGTGYLESGPLGHGQWFATSSEDGVFGSGQPGYPAAQANPGQRLGCQFRCEIGSPVPHRPGDGPAFDEPSLACLAR